MEIAPETLSDRDRYLLSIACIVPRPIAWVSTQDAAGVTNLAPFSYFGGVSSSPPIVTVSVGRRRGERKDTARNLLETGEAVVHIVDRPRAEAMVETAGDVLPDVDEFALAELPKAPSRIVAPPRVADAPIAMEARLHRHLEVGDGPVDLFLLELVHFHLRDDVLDAAGRPDPRRLRAVGRLGGAWYAEVDDPFEVTRPRGG